MIRLSPSSSRPAAARSRTALSTASRSSGSSLPPDSSRVRSSSVVGLGWRWSTCWRTADSAARSSSLVLRMCSLSSTSAYISRSSAFLFPLPPTSAPAGVARFERRQGPGLFDHRSVEVLRRAANLARAHQLNRVAFGQHAYVVAERAERLVELARQLAWADLRRAGQHRPQDLSPQRMTERVEGVVLFGGASRHAASNIEQTKSIVWQTVSCARARASLAVRGCLRVLADAAHLGEDRGEAVAVALLVGDHVGDGVDQRQVGEGLGEVAQMAAALRLELLGVEVEPAGGGEQALAERPRPRALADLRERRDEPEGADQEAALLAAEAVVGLLDLVAEDEPVLGQLGGDRLDRGAHARVIGRQEAQQRDQQGGGVEGVGLVVLAKDAPAHAALEDLLPHAGRRALPLLGQLVDPETAREASAAVDRDPDHQLRGDVVLGFAARLPDSLVGVWPGRDRRFDLVADQLAIGRRAAAAQRLLVQVDRIEQGAPDVVLTLAVGAVADPHRAGAAVAAEVVERALGQLPLAADPVHDLQAGVVLADVDDEAHEVARLLVEAERVQGPEAEGRVADPAVAVVPVALVAGGLRQRGRRRGDDRAAGRVGEALEHEGGALQVDAPGVVGELAGAQPAAPELFGRVEPLERLGRAARAAEVAVAPGKGTEAALVLAQAQGAAGGAVLDGQLHVAGQEQLAPLLGACDRFAQLAAAPARRGGAVGEARQALHLDLDLAVDAGHQPQQRAVGLVRGARPAVAAVLGRPLGDREQVVGDDPARVGHPGGLDHQRPRLVAAADRHDDAARRDLEVAGAAVEQRRED